MKLIQSISYKALFYISLYISFLILFTTSELIESPDFLYKYVNYYYYYSGNLEITNIEQGHFYYFYQYLLSLVISKLNSTLNLYEVLNLAFHVGNTFFYLIGLLGIRKYLIKSGYSEKNVLLVLSVTNFMTAGIFLRLTLKPEILVIAFLPWIFIKLDKFLEERNLSSLIIGTILSSFLFASKASITILVGLLLFLIYRKYLLKNFIYLIPILLFTLILLVESFILNGRTFVDVEHNENYNNQASIEFFTTLDSKNLVNNPNKYFHNRSFVGITMFDTFNDFFGLYWNSQYSLLNADRKDFFIINKVNDNTRPLKISFDKETRVFKLQGNFDTRWDDPNYIDETRFRFGFIFSIIFYFLSLFIGVFNKKFKVLILSPFLGILFISLSALGFFGNNFDPLVGDSVKTFYYSFFVTLSFIFCFLILVSNFPLRKITSFLTVLFFLFLIGFPHSYNQNTEEVIEYKNSQLISCESNINILTIIYGLETEIECLEINTTLKRLDNMEYFNYFDLKFYKFPYVTIFLSIVLIIFYIFEKTDFWMASVKLNEYKIFK